MIYECTDCKYCADFDYGYRVFCLHPQLPPDEVCKYHPVGYGDAENCMKFDDDEPQRFSMKELEQAEKYSQDHYGDVTYEGVRKWCEQRKDNNHDEILP